MIGIICYEKEIFNMRDMYLLGQDFLGQTR